jgi:DNA-directed RNA polymerase subunit M/transcription elongation factor TFIIS
MPATITIACPECDKQMKAPAAAEGKKVRCKACGAIFVAVVEVEVVDEVDEVDEVEEVPAKKPARKAPPPPPSKKAPPPPAKGGPAKSPAKNDEDDDNPYGLTFEDLSARCPECANLMASEDAKVCLYCGFNTETRERSRTRKVKEQTPLDIFLWLLPGIACALAVVLMVAWIIIHWGPLINWMGLDPEKDKDTWIFMVVALYTKIWTTVILAFLIFNAGFFAIKRLAINYKPPEIEEKIKKKL